MMRALLALALVGTATCELQGFIDGPLNPSGSIVFLSKLFEDGPSWTDTPKPKFVEVPAWMNGNAMLAPKISVEVGSTLGIRCQRPANKKGCLMYVFQYKCIGCDFEAGGIKELMEGKGFEMTNCAPKFALDGDVHHPMGGWRAWYKDTETMVVPISKTTEYTILVSDENAEYCPELTQSQCEETDLKGQCEWNEAAAECTFRTCKKKFTGPHIGIGGGSGPLTCARKCAVLEDFLGMP